MKYFIVIRTAVLSLTIFFLSVSCTILLDGGSLFRKEVDDSGEWVREKAADHDVSSDSKFLEDNSSGNSGWKDDSVKHYPVKEILYIRSSVSESDDPTPDTEKSVLDAKNSEDVIKPGSGQPVPGKDQIVSSTFRNSSVSNCSIYDYSSNLEQTCPSGPEYSFQFQFMYSDNAKSQMEDMLPQSAPMISKCDYQRTLGPESSIEDRAACPFEWTVGDLNPSRIPPYLYHAKCSCQKSRKIGGRRYDCVPVMKAIPVLWIVDCQEERRKYRSGWEMIAIACGPLEVREAEVVDILPLA